MPESYKIRKFGQVKTLADVVKTLNGESHYTSLDELMEDYNHVMLRSVLSSPAVTD